MKLPDIESTHTDLPIDVNLPTTEEITKAIRQIKNGEAARPDNIPAEALKEFNELFRILEKHLTTLLLRILKKSSTHHSK
ncbi:unnamed protein product [Schistosoma margrebowiei]|uniref:Uncharacterized protein n=1 Tax=Schistosoma margrebowiei TaxID=48269 RepID=A0A183L963_9TREM|nr:unnamed protein product [Schistosoma margrebowiei]